MAWLGALGCGSGLLAQPPGPPEQAIDLQPRWRESRGNLPDGPSLVYDSVRGEVVWLGTHRDGLKTLCWTWSGTEWLPRSCEGAAPRAGSWSVAFDEARGKAVLFGLSYESWFSGQPVVETWEWDGRRYELRENHSGSTGPELGTIVYDPNRARTLLLTHGTFQQTHTETWEWDGVQWTRRTPALSPPVLFAAARTYDHHRKRAVFFAGTSQTWEWDGSNWSARTTTNLPRWYQGNPMVYDPVQRRSQLYLLENKALCLWDWDGLAWSRSAIQPLSVQGSGPSLAAYDWPRFRAVTILWSEARVETWETDPWQWQLRRVIAIPERRWDSAIAYDTDRKRLVLYGGQAGLKSDFADTWEWDGSVWTQFAVNGPGPRERHALFYHPVLRRTFLVAGFDRNYMWNPSDLWEWNGSRWAFRGPVPSDLYSLEQKGTAYDSARNRLVMHARGGSSWEYSTWEWDMVGFRRAAPTVHPQPQPRHDYAMVYDSERRTTVLVSSPLPGPDPVWEIWEWGGERWSHVAYARGPSPRRGFSLAYDPVRRCVVLFGGDDGQRVSAETWEWDGAAWTLLAPSSNLLTPRAWASMCFDETWRELVLIGGMEWGLPMTASPGAWVRGTSRAARVLEVGSGCAGGRGTPGLIAGAPICGNGGFRLDVATAPPWAPTWIGFSVRSRAQPLGPSCTLWLDTPLLPSVALADSRGTAQHPVALPLDPRLLGQVLYAQGVVQDPQGAWLGLAFTSCLELRIGD